MVPLVEVLPWCCMLGEWLKCPKYHSLRFRWREKEIEPTKMDWFNSIGGISHTTGSKQTNMDYEYAGGNSQSSKVWENMTEFCMSGLAADSHRHTQTWIDNYLHTRMWYNMCFCTVYFFAHATHVYVSACGHCSSPGTQSIYNNSYYMHMNMFACFNVPVKRNGWKSGGIDRDQELLHLRCIGCG